MKNPTTPSVTRAMMPSRAAPKFRNVWIYEFKPSPPARISEMLTAGRPRRDRIWLSLGKDRIKAGKFCLVTNSADYQPFSNDYAVAFGTARKVSLRLQ